MNSEIPKYMAYVKAEKKLMDVVRINWINKTVSLLDLPEKGALFQAGIPMCDIELLPYTTFKDNRGSEIWDRDVVEVVQDRIYYGKRQTLKRKYLVMMESGAWILKSKKGMTLNLHNAASIRGGDSDQFKTKLKRLGSSLDQPELMEEVR